MTTISEKDRAEAQAMFEAFHGGSLARPTCGRRGRPMACTTPSTYSTASPPTKPDSPCTPNTSPTEKRRDPARCGHCGQTTEGA